MTQQLKIQFEHRNTVRQNLRDGTFSIFLEYAPPTADQPFKLAMKPGIELAGFAEKDDRIASLAITHNYSGYPGHDLVKVAEYLHEHCRKESIVYLSGRGMDARECRRLLAGLVSLGINTVCAVSGLAGADHPRDKRGRALCEPGSYLDACDQLRLIRADYPDMFLGATTNPFKYNISDVYLQYSKMVKKLNCGAGFVVAQAGWDMKKYQELQWYLQSRNVNDPFVARLLLLAPRDIAPILRNGQGGIIMSREFGALLQRESQVSDAQALTAQIRRISLQAAGCRLLGYSGIQLAGLHDVGVARTVVDRVVEALAEFQDYNSWLDAWSDFHNRIEMAPYPYRYYAFKQLLEKDAPTIDPEADLHTSFTIPPPGLADKARYRMGKFLGLERHDGPIARAARAVVCQGGIQRDWKVKGTFYLAASSCPKGLQAGACGGSWPDGTCELGGRPCFYHRVLSLADWRNHLEALEERDATR